MFVWLKGLGQRKLLAPGDRDVKIPQQNWNCTPRGDQKTTELKTKKETPLCTQASKHTGVLSSAYSSPERSPVFLLFRGLFSSRSAAKRLRRIIESEFRVAFHNRQDCRCGETEIARISKTVNNGRYETPSAAEPESREARVTLDVIEHINPDPAKYVSYLEAG